MVNPFYIFIAAFLSIGAAYFLGYSELYPPLSFSLIFFFLVIFLVMGIMGYLFQQKKIIRFFPVTGNTNLIYLTITMILLTLIEGIYSHGLPLTDMLLGRDSGYAEFGIPVVHVILMTFNAFLSTYLFQLLLSKFQKSYLVLFLLSLIPNVLVVNRGMLTMVLMNCIWIYLIYLGKRIKIRQVIVLIPIALIGLYAFGVMGNARLNTSYQNGNSAFDSSEFMDIGQANDSFRNSSIPKEYFWGYIYATSPLANLQMNIDFHNTEAHSSAREWNAFFFNEMIPDFIGKRIVAQKDYLSTEKLKVTPELNVSTAFIGPYMWLGWLGILIFICYMILIAILYIFLLQRIHSKFFIVGVSTINTVFLFSFFANMISFTGLSFQLIYPLLFTIWNAWCQEKNSDYLSI